MPSFFNKLKDLLSSSSQNKTELSKYADQYPGVEENEENILDVTIGLDFGTAFTKVIVRTGLDFSVISFEEFKPDNKFLLPSILYVDEDNVCCLDPKNIKEYSGLKDHIVHDKIEILYEDHETLGSIVFFIALVFQHTRYKFLLNNWAQFNQRYIKWNINIGMPEATLVENEKKQLYESITKLAWGLSLKEESIFFDIEKLTDESNFREEDIFVFPETTAFLLSVEKSNVYRRGHYILIDIGAGTTDISYLHIHDVDGDIKHILHYTSVENHGTAMFMDFLIKKSNSDFFWSRHDNFPELDELQRGLGLESENFKNIKNEFMDRFTKQLSENYKGGFSHFNVNDRESLRLGHQRFCYIITGGGSNIDVYVERAEILALNNEELNLSRLNLPKPDLKPDSITEKDFERLAVAYGLAWDRFDLAETLKYKVENEGNDNRDFRENYVGPEQM
jgi:hypothetical protein